MFVIIARGRSFLGPSELKVSGGFVRGVNRIDSKCLKNRYNGLQKTAGINFAAFLIDWP